MKKVIKQKENGFYYLDTEVEVKDVLLLLVCVVILVILMVKNSLVWYSEMVNMDAYELIKLV